MTPEDIRAAWMNPATPQKYTKKKAGKGRTPEKKRVLQGDKGIGRFAILKLGKKITITTRSRNSTFESVLEYDFTKFDDDFTEERGTVKEIFLDQIQIDYSESGPPKQIQRPNGTLIKVQKLKGSWGAKAIEDLSRDLSSLTDPISRITEHQARDEFQISIICNGTLVRIADKNEEDFERINRKQACVKNRRRI